MSTIALIETLYDLLRQKTPNTQRALSLIEQAMTSGICREERDRSRRIVEGLLSILEQWFGTRGDISSTLDDCRRFTDHEYDPERFAQACAPLFALAVPQNQLHDDDAHTKRVQKTIDVLNLLASEDTRIEKMVQSLPTEQPSIKQLAHFLESFGTLGPMSQKKHDDERLWDNAWRRLEQGLTLMVQEPDPDHQTNALYQKRDQPPEEHDREPRIVRVIELAEAWMREAGRIGQQLEEYRTKGQQLKLRIDALDTAITASQTEYFIDPQTGLSDHSGFSIRLHRLLDRASHLGELFSLGVIQIKDHPAHATHSGKTTLDRMIRMIAESVRQHLATTDFIARLAPNRLGLLFPKTDAKRCTAIIHTLNQSLKEQEWNPGTSRLNIVCAGLSFQQGMTIKEIMHKVAQLADHMGPIAVPPRQEPQLPIDTTITSDKIAPEEISLD
ncbi:MAG: diguanylate cyclase [Magnetococcales bacterium]|nr:diguanylate cyclase [Magnetococcales bacterium]